MKKRVYLVEDNEKNMKLFKAVLNTMPDIEVIAETHGGRAFESLKSDTPDLIILDIQLPEMSGIDICKELRKLEKYKNIPIIAVTSFAMKGDKERILKAGFDTYIPKPININDFRKTVKNVII